MNNSRQNPITHNSVTISQQVVNPVSMEASEEARAKVLIEQKSGSYAISQQVVNPVANQANCHGGPQAFAQEPLAMRPIPGPHLGG